MKARRERSTRKREKETDLDFVWASDFFVLFIFSKNSNNIATFFKVFREFTTMVDEKFIRLCASGNKDGVAEIIEQNKETESKPHLEKILHGKTPIEVATCFGRLNVVEELINNGGIDINQVSESGKIF